METRGIRNHNPGNLRLSGDKWLGEVPGVDRAFKTFSEPVYGIRALAKLLLNYELKYGLNTVSGLISRWAPSIENDTNAYVKAVAGACDVDAYEPIDVAAYLTCLVPAIIRHENGNQPYSLETIERGIDLALGGGSGKTDQNVAPAQPEPVAPGVPPYSVLPTGDSQEVVEKVVAPVFPLPVSKKLCVAILGLLAILLNGPLGLGLDDQQLGDLVKLLSSYLIGQAGVDALKPFVTALTKGGTNA